MNHEDRVGQLALFDRQVTTSPLKAHTQRPKRIRKVHCNRRSEPSKIRLLFEESEPLRIAEVALTHARMFPDDAFPENERLPRHFELSFVATTHCGHRAIQLLQAGEQVGDVLTDNSNHDDGYRFHDVFHFAHAAVLGWSPMTRTLFKRKRKSDPSMDVVEDGARAKILEEVICALVFDYARREDFFKLAHRVDRSLLRQIKSLTTDREVETKSEDEWEDAILQGYHVWRAMREHEGGILVGDMLHQSVSYRRL